MGRVIGVVGLAIAVLTGCSGTGAAVSPMVAGFNLGFWVFIAAVIGGIPPCAETHHAAWRK